MDFPGVLSQPTLKAVDTSAISTAPRRGFLTRGAGAVVAVSLPKAEGTEETVSRAKFQTSTKGNEFMNTMRVAQVPGPKREFEIVQRPIPDPTPGTVRIKVAACGICHSDALVKEGLWPGLQYPRVPGHEVSGTIDAVGEGV